MPCTMGGDGAPVMKTKVETVKLKSYDIISRAVEEGIAFGLNRAYKYADNPSREDFEQRIRDAIMSELTDVINWD